MTEPEAPRVTVTRPDADGRPVELLEVGSQDPRELPRWAKRSLAGAVAAVLLVSVGSDLVERWQQHRAEQRAADALVLRPGEGGGGPAGGQVTLSVGLRNDGPRPVRLRDPRLTADGLEGIVGVTAPEVVAAGAQASLAATVQAICPAADLTSTRVVVSVTAVAESGREERVELEVPSLQAMLEAACRAPSPADDLVVEVADARRDGGAIRVLVRVSTAAGAEGELVSVGSPVFGHTGFDGPVGLVGVGSVEVGLLLSRPVCDAVQPLPGGGGVRVPVDLVVRAVTDRSGAGDGRGPRPDGSRPDLTADGVGLVVGRDLAVDAGPAGERLAVLAQQLVQATCG